MSNETIYSVKTRYSVEDKASRGTGAVVSSARDLDKAARGATGSLKAMGMAVVGAFSARAAYGALLKFNSTVEDTKNQIAGMLSLSKKTNLSDELGNADRLFANLQRRAAKLPGTTQEYATMAGMLTQPITSAGLGMKDLEDMTVNAVVAAKALRVESGAAARDVDQALRGQYHSVDVFTGKLLGSIGYAGESGREKYNALSGDKRASELKRAMMQPQIEQLAAAQGNTFSGVLSTVQDTIQQTLGKVGLPLFKAITNEMKTWNTWLDANSAKVDQWAKSFGEGIVDGFKVVRSAIGFLVDHASLLITVAKAWAAIKIGSTIGNIAGALGGGGSGLIGTLAGMGLGGKVATDEWKTDKWSGERTYGGMKSERPGAIKGFGGAMGALPYAGAALLGGYALGNALGLDKVGADIGGAFAHLTGRTDAVTDEFYKIERAGSHLAASLEAAARAGGPRAITNMRGGAADYAQQANLVRDAMAAYQALQNGGGLGARMDFMSKKAAAEAAGIGWSDVMGAGGPGAFVDAMQAKSGALSGRADVASLDTLLAIAAGTQMMTDYQRQTLDNDVAQTRVSEYIAQHFDKIDLHEIWDILRNATQDPSGTHKTITDKPKVNVTIQRIEVASDDPDRFAFGLVEAFRQAAKNPSAAIAAMREG